MINFMDVDVGQRFEWCRMSSLPSCKGEPGYTPVSKRSSTQYRPRGADAVVVTVPLNTVAFTARPIAGRPIACIILDTLEWAFMVLVCTFKLDISFRLSRLRVTGRRSVVYGRANIDVIIRPLGGRTGAVLFKL